MKFTLISQAIADLFGKSQPRHGFSAMTYALAGGPFHSIKL